MQGLILVVGVLIALPIIMMFAAWLCGVRYIPHQKVGVIEKLFSASGSLTEGRIVAQNGEAGFQTRLLRGGLHFGLLPWQYRIHREPLVTVSESKIGYVYARDGAPLPPAQTLGGVVECISFQDAQAFLINGGQRGRQRAILREGVYAINQALFVVITEDRVYSGPLRDKDEKTYQDWQEQLGSQRGFDPVIIGVGAPLVAMPAEKDIPSSLGPTDVLGIVTVHDGLPIEHGEIIAPEIPPQTSGLDHHYFQITEAFLAMGGRRGKQLQVLTDGTFFINRWFATIEPRPKTMIPIGFVGVVVSYYGTKGTDVTGVDFRYGEQVEPGQRGVWRVALPPGKYALNPYALKVELVPTVNFVLRWITGQVESHQYDKDLESIELITADGYEPVLPLSLVLHIDYQKASSVVQRFGDVRRLISQTLDPILTAYFRDVAQSSSMLDLLTHREDIQKRATDELGRRFKDYDINCVAVLIGRPNSTVAAGQVDPIERLFDQLRQRRLAQEQKETFQRQQEAALQLKQLNEAQAAAAKQTELTQTSIDIQVSANKGESALAEAQRLAKRDIARAEGESRSKAIQAQGDRDANISRSEGEARSKELLGKAEGDRIEAVGRGEAARAAQVGLAEAAVNLQKNRAYGDPRLYALNLVSDQFARSEQPIVPERVFIMNGGSKDGDGKSDIGSVNLLSQLLGLLLSEKSGINISEKNPELATLDKFTDEMTKRLKETPPAVATGNGGRNN